MVLHCSYWEIDEDMVVSTATHLLEVEGVGGGPAMQLLGDRPGHGAMMVVSTATQNFGE